MSDEKTSPAVEPTEHTAAPTHTPAGRPTGWMHKGFRVAGHEFWYASPIVQLVMVALVCFLCPGMFNALGGLGAGGQVDATAQNNASTALYSVFAVVAFFSGTIVNTLGVKLTLSFGGLGYCIYAASFLSYNHNENFGFVIFAGAFLGLCAGLLWTAQGTIMMSYPHEEKKGRYIALFWIIFNMGAVIGSLIPLGQNINSTGTGPVNDGTYVGFIVLMFVGAVLALFLVNASSVIRDDGSKVILMKNPSWKTEFQGLIDTITQAPWVILLFPMFFASNTFYTYQQNDFNGAHFNTRTRALNNTLYWTSQILGAIVFGYGLDYGKARRSVRAKVSFIALSVVMLVVWGGGWDWQRKQAPREVVESKTVQYVGYDWTDGGDKFIGPMFLMMFYGFFDAAWQTSIYWYMGALSNSGRKAANLAGFYKGIQSAGAAVFWALDGTKQPYNTMFGATWGLVTGALIFAAPVIWLKIKDTVTIEEDLKFSDETVADVAPTSVVVTQRKEEEA
ncbi:major facilitator superfamily domain-containing protein [Lasiosphaeria hispida]|uniref:Major facilitator superfamily domain-containing protein n=1 Tax=Lasiosphaeria hispida TaxID=260671 RepID=A0AAJ0H8X9_9PEZI|nr:major facilitator superfamily domain-containing protein [Lasiosphaeria hispida]